MKITIYGKEGCPYCIKAKNLVNEIINTTTCSIDLEYHDIISENISKDFMSKVMGFTVTTVPQILIDGKPIKGGYSGFNEYIGNEIAKGNIEFK